MLATRRLGNHRSVTGRLAPAMGDAVLFPGQGSQAEGMADAWMRHPAGAATLAEASDAIGRDVVAGCHDAAALATTSFVQPALLACGVAAFRVLRAEGLPDPVGVAGHSLGEFAALVAAEAAGLADVLELVVVRGEAMQAAGEARPGAMTALLGLGAEDAQTLVDEVRGDDVLVVANENSPAQVVASGSVGGDRAARGAREGTADARGAAAGRGRLPLRADATRRRAGPRGSRADRGPRPDGPDRGERDRFARHRRRRAPRAPRPTGRLARAVGGGGPSPRGRRAPRGSSRRAPATSSPSS